ncbi:hypothetical protein ACFQ0G_53155 [Streptomyces chiangmaiensis]|uniref:hypothetical protein n=1 Tax=Streptomyces chiangmaiensis TaxID=766497 RepID=UPI0031EFFC1D
MATRTATTPLPMPGRLAVSYRDWGLDMTSLDQVATGTVVTTVGTISHVRYLDRQGVRRAVRTGDKTSLGRVMLVLVDGRGNSAHITLNADVVAMLHPVLYRGAKLSVRGLVTRTISSQPAGIAGLGVQVVND